MTTQPSADQRAAPACPVVTHLSHGGELIPLVEQSKHLAALAARDARIAELEGDAAHWLSEVQRLCAVLVADAKVIGRYERDAARQLFLRDPKRSHALVGSVADPTGRAERLSEFALDRAIDDAVRVDAAQPPDREALVAEVMQVVFANTVPIIGRVSYDTIESAVRKLAGLA